MKGVVFDLDGTLVDNMELHAEAFVRFNARYGLPPFGPEARARFDGQRNRDIFPALFGRELPPDELSRYIHEKESLYRDLSRGRLAPLRGLVPFLDRLAQAGIPAAIATSAPAENVRHTLSELGLGGRLQAVVRSDEVPRGKPHPDVFLAAAARLGVAPRECVAFEDAPMGVRAARAAGMTCVAVATTFAAEDFARAGAAPDYLVRDFEEVLAGGVLPVPWSGDGAF